MVKEYGYEYDTVLDKELYGKVKGEVAHEKFMGALCLRSGRDALKVVAREFEPTEVLMPALACDSMILPFEMYGHKVKYYKLNEDYSIDIRSLYSLITDEGKAILFLYMDYFGNKALSDSELEKLKIEHQYMIFVEDCTHNLIVQHNYFFKPDFIVASLRKWIDIPDGGLLWTGRELKKETFGDDLSFAEIRLKAQLMRHEFLQSGDERLKKEYRRIFSTVTDKIDEEKLPGLMSRYSYEKAKEANLKEINSIRARNAQVLIDELQGFKFVQSESGLGDAYVAILINNRDAIQRKLASIGIFCTIIWPLNDEQRKACEIAKYTEGHMLTIYCDQRHSVEDMKYIASCIKGVCNE